MSYTPPPAYGPQLTTAPAPKKGKGKLVAAIVFALLSPCFLGVVIAAVSGDGGTSKRPGDSGFVTPTTYGAPASTGGAEPAAAVDTEPARPRALKASDLSLSVKITSKQCFGSAGCNVEYQIKATLLTTDEFNAPCDVTYEVRGLEDPVTSTLTIVDSTTFRQDSWQFGQTSSSSKKLTAKVTEVDC